MQDEVDTATKWRCPLCGEVVESDFCQITYEIQRHKRKCTKQPQPVTKSVKVREG